MGLLMSRQSSPRRFDRLVVKTPVRTEPPITRRGSSASRRLSEEERGAESDDDGSSVASPFPSSSPLPTRRLFSDDNSLWARSGWFQACIAAALVLMSASAWLPVFVWLLGRGDLEQPASMGGRARVGSEMHEEWSAHAHLFHEPRCAGESLVLSRPADLCGWRFASGAEAKDNVASVLLAGGGDTELLIFGTCKLQEQPANPMLLETVSAQGCSDLKYPLIGSLEVRVRHRAGELETAEAELESEL